MVRVHDVLAESGLCCAGKTCEGGEGVFLKMAIKHFLHLEMKLKTAMPNSVVNDFVSKLNDEASTEVVINSISSDHDLLKVDETSIDEKLVEGFKESHSDKKRKLTTSEQVSDIEKKKTDIGLDMALDQSFFCLYGLNLRGGLDSTGGQDGLAMHINTSLGEYQTKEQCAEVFQYLLPYARVCTVNSYHSIPTLYEQLTDSCHCYFSVIIHIFCFLDLHQTCQLLYVHACSCNAYCYIK